MTDDNESLRAELERLRLLADGHSACAAGLAEELATVRAELERVAGERDEARAALYSTDLATARAETDEARDAAVRMADEVVRLRAENDRLARWLDRSITAHDAAHYVIGRLLAEAADAPNAWEVDATLVADDGTRRTARVSVAWADGESVHSLLATALRERDEATAEVARLRRRMETMPPWDVSAAPTDEEMRALRFRWANGPERYQADADALIAAVIEGRRELTEARAALREYAPRCGECDAPATHDDPRFFSPEDRYGCDLHRDEGGELVGAAALRALGGGR